MSLTKTIKMEISMSKAKPVKGDSWQKMKGIKWGEKYE